MPRFDLLREAVALVEGLRDEEFNICIYHCESVGCFVGWGGTLPSWQAVGLITLNGRFDTSREDDFEHRNEAVARILEIEEKDCEFMFFDRTRIVNDKLEKRTRQMVLADVKAYIERIEGKR